ncbi:MAG: hypothetical protein IT562_19360 [Alphaproteobacteria bacterium]|nr:hypothetical protein [Alphaproteobacteria bacterium]
MRGLGEWIADRGVVLLFAGVFAGLALPGLAAFLRPAVVPFTFVLFVASLLRLDWAVIRHHARRPLRAGMIVAAILVAAPLAAAALFRLLPVPPGLALSVVLTTTTTPLMSSPAFALLLGLEAELALIVVVAAMLLVPVTMPALALALLGLQIDLSTGELMARLVAFVGGGFVLATALRRLIGIDRIRADARVLDGAIVILLVVFAIGVMDGVTTRLIAEPGQVFLFTAAAFLLNAAQQVAGATVFWLAGRRQALTVGLLFGYRNMALVLAVLGEAAPADFLLFVAVAQLPMYMFPILTRRVYRALLDR